MDDIQKEALTTFNLLYSQHQGNYQSAIEQTEDEIRHAIHTGDTKEQQIQERVLDLLKVSMNDQDRSSKPLDMTLFISFWGI